MTITGVRISGGKATVETDGVETDRDNLVDGMTRLVALLTSIARGDERDQVPWPGAVVQEFARECLDKVGITWTRT
jgi:hypothetical protein